MQSASTKCSKCSRPALAGRSLCIEHHKETQGYSYGLDHDIQQKMASKYDPAKANAVRAWIESVTGRRFASSDLQESLKSGVLLCELIMKLAPGSVKKINAGAMPFVQRENIVSYLSACKGYGVRETDQFVTGDLYEGSNINQVIDQICALGQLAAQKNWSGPKLVISGGAVQVSTSTYSAPSAVAVVKPNTGSLPPNPTYTPGSSSLTSSSSTSTYKPSTFSSTPTSSYSTSTASSAPKPAADAPKFCGQCGTKRADLTAKFCGQCGSKFA